MRRKPDEQKRQPQEILARMYKYCAYQDRCESEVRDKLTELGATPDESVSFMEALKAGNFYDDLRFARSFARGKLHKGWGPDKVKAGLFQKRIAQDMIRDVLNEVFTNEEAQAMKRKLAEKKKKELGGSDSADAKLKLKRYLWQKGWGGTGDL